MQELTYKRLRWACRRGMLELDEMLLKFLEEAYPRLTLEDQQIFEKLLTEADPDLFAWLMGNQAIDNPELQAIIKKIRHHAQPSMAD